MSDTHDGLWIRDLRQRLGLSQVELASRLGVSNVSVNRWERGRVTPELTTIRRLIQLERHLNAPAEAAGNGSRPPGNLPVARNRFIGRQVEIAAINAARQSSSLVSLVGPAGSGKTRLAIEFGHRVETHFPDGVWFVDLSTVTDARQVGEAMAATLGIRPSERAGSIERVIASLRSRSLLLIVDNCEHLIASVAEIVSELVSSNPDVVTLLTSRAALGISGEHVLSVEPLTIPFAVQLFRDRAERARRAPLPEDQGDAILDLCRRLDCLPLAIELAAARSHLMMPTQMLDRLEDRFSLLSSASSGTRQATLLTALDWSHDLLSEPDRIIFRRLGIFAGEFDLEAAEAICCDESSNRWQTIDAIDRLIGQSLLAPVPASRSSSAVRYVMLESIREYARTHLDAAGERQVLVERHADHCLRVAHDAGSLLHGPRHLEGLARLDREHDDIAAALLWAVRRGDAATATAIAAAMWPAWQARGRYLDGTRQLEETLALTGEADPAARAEVLTGAAMLRLRLGEHDRARGLAEQALASWRALGRRDGEARLYDLLGLLALRSGSLETSERHHRHAYELSLAALDDAGIVRSLTVLGQLANTRGNTGEAERIYTEAWRIARRLNNLESESVLLLDLGDVAAREGRFREAVAFYEQALAMNRQLGNPDRTAAIVSNLAEVRINTGEVRRAIEEARDGVAQYRRLGNRAHLADALYILGAAWHAAREDADALVALREALGIYVDLGNEVYAAHTIEVMAEIATRHGAPVEAARLFGGAAAIRARAGVAPYALFDYDAALATLDSSLERQRLNAERAAGAADPFLRLVLLALSLTAGDSANRNESARPSPNDVLTERQTEILRLVAAGLSNRAIADELAISERTVERHLSAIYLALDVDRRSSAVAYAVLHGLHRGPAG